jgi:hypothetical protein
MPPSTERSVAISFLDLPPEIRNMIYLHMLVGEEKLTIRYNYASNKPYARNSNNCVSALKICRQINREVASIVYGRLELHCNFPHAMLKFFKMIGLTNQVGLRKLELTLKPGIVEDIQKLTQVIRKLGALESLKYLVVGLSARFSAKSSTETRIRPISHFFEPYTRLIEALGQTDYVDQLRMVYENGPAERRILSILHESRIGHWTCRA